MSPQSLKLLSGEQLQAARKAAARLLEAALAEMLPEPLEDVEARAEEERRALRRLLENE